MDFCVHTIFFLDSTQVYVLHVQKQSSGNKISNVRFFSTDMLGLPREYKANQV